MDGFSDLWTIQVTNSNEKTKLLSQSPDHTSVQVMEGNNNIPINTIITHPHMYKHCFFFSFASCNAVMKENCTPVDCNQCRE